MPMPGLLRVLAMATRLFARQGANPPATCPSADDSREQVKEAGEALQKGEFQSALDISRKVMAAAPGNIVAYDLAGNASLRLHDCTAAIGYFQPALQLQPDEARNVAGLLGAYSLAGESTEEAAEREHVRSLKAANRLPPNFSGSVRLPSTVTAATVTQPSSSTRVSPRTRPRARTHGNSSPQPACHVSDNAAGLARQLVCASDRLRPVRS
jgi:tetratricopeptide (TPR) repeat protein